MKGYVFSERFTKNHRAEIIDVHRDGKNVAYVRSLPKNRIGVVYVDALYVAPEHRGKELSHELLRRVVNKYKTKELRLQVDPFKDKPLSVSKLKKLYSGYGFESVGRWQMVRKPLEKAAGGDILGRLAGLVTRPIVGAARSHAIQNNIIGGVTNYVNQPIENALKTTGIHKAISKVYEHGTRPIPGTPRFVQPVMPDPAQRRAYGQWRADDIVHTVANNPEIVGALGVPLPGVTTSYLAGKHLLSRALGGGVKKLAAFTESFADELEKLALTGQHFSQPEEFEERQECDRRKEELSKIAEASSLRAYLNHAALNSGQAARDIRYFHDHPDADRVAGRGTAKHVASSITSRVPSLTSNLYYSALPPQLHHTKEELDSMEGGAKDWFLHGYNPWDHEDPSKAKTKTAQVRPYQQKTQWTCSAACLKAVLEHWGVKLPELTIIEAIGAKKGRGAECDEIAAAARKLGFLAFEYSFDSLDQAKVLLDQDIPIICDIQSFNNPGKGHYVVMTGVWEGDAGSGSRVEIMDPNTPGNSRTISREEMDERWWDRAMAPPHKMMPRWGIVVIPPEDTGGAS